VGRKRGGKEGGGDGGEGRGDKGGDDNWIDDAGRQGRCSLKTVLPVPGLLLPLAEFTGSRAAGFLQL
jgi:hypothetical protein